MGAEYTNAQKNATKKYMEDKHVIRFVVKKEKASEYKLLSEEAGKSLSQFIIDLIEDYIEKRQK